MKLAPSPPTPTQTHTSCNAYYLGQPSAFLNYSLPSFSTPSTSSQVSSFPSFIELPSLVFHLEP